MVKKSEEVGHQLPAELCYCFGFELTTVSTLMVSPILGFKLFFQIFFAW